MSVISVNVNQMVFVTEFMCFMCCRLPTFWDLRIDTVSKPTDEMRKAMFKDPVGDDVYGDDPTCNCV